MRLLLGSGGFRTEERITFLAQTMRTFFGDIDKLLFVPYALHDHDGYITILSDKGINAGYTLDGIHRYDDPRQAVRDAQAMFIGGGNSFRLLHHLYEKDLLEVIRERVRTGMPYMGVSAGSNVACPTIMTTNDMPITMPPSFEALNLFPWQINPHYFNGHTYVKSNNEYHEHFGETRDERIQEFHELNDTTVLGLWEAGVLRWEAEQLSLTGAPVRIFRKGKEPMDVQPDTDLTDRL